MAECRSCRAPMVWATHPVTGKPNPIDDEASPEGNIRINDDGTYAVLAGERLARARDLGEKLHLSHFVTCPHRDRWRG